jgi:hypothetical protein
LQKLKFPQSYQRLYDFHLFIIKYILRTIQLDVKLVLIDIEILLGTSRPLSSHNRFHVREIAIFRVLILRITFEVHISRKFPAHHAHVHLASDAGIGDFWLGDLVLTDTAKERVNGV